MSFMEAASRFLDANFHPACQTQNSHLHNSMSGGALLNDIHLFSLVWDLVKRRDAESYCRSNGTVSSTSRLTT